MIIDIRKEMVILGEEQKWVKCQENSKGLMRVELRQRRREQGWWESGWKRAGGCQCKKEIEKVYEN